MILKVMIPQRILMDEPVSKVTAEAEDGALGILPGHMNYITALVPGLLGYEDEHENERFLALDEGILLKVGDRVTVSVRDGLEARELGSLQQYVHERTAERESKSRHARSALDLLEADFIRRYVETRQE